MHEMALAQGILDVACKIAAEHQAARVLKITVLVGQMTQVEPEALTFGFSALASGTVAEQAELELIRVPLVGRCNDCGGEFPIVDYCFSCPTCQSVGVSILSGRELRVEHLEVE